MWLSVLIQVVERMNQPIVIVSSASVYIDTMKLSEGIYILTLSNVTLALIQRNWANAYKEYQNSSSGS